MAEILKKYKWMGPLIQKMDRDIKKVFMKSFRMRDKNFFPEGDYKADVKNLVTYKARIGYYLTIGKIDYSDSDFVNLMYKCTNEESCKVWCPFGFSVVSLLETVRDDINAKGYMPDYCKEQVKKLKESNTIEGYNIYDWM